MNTMITEAPASTTRLGVGFDANRGQTQNRDAWKRSIGTKQVPARLAMLPEGASRWQRLGVSAIVQIIILGFFVALPIFFPERLKTALNMQVVPLSMPVTEVPVAPPPPPPKAKVAPTPKPVVIEEPKLNPKQPHIFVQQKVLPNLNTGSAAVPTVNLPVNKVQTGGFGDPNGLPGKGDTNKTTNVNRLGSPALPGGPGYGNGTGGDKGVKGVVASTGFGNGIANPPQGGGKQGVVQKSGFGDQTVVAEAPKKKASADSATSQVDILSKPRPEYTAEGRALKLEGDVVVDVVFLASGKVQVSRVVSGLGHGLDESAARAAQQIQFKPAKRDGEAVDFPARVRIEFRLAY